MLLAFSQNCAIPSVKYSWQTRNCPCRIEFAVVFRGFVSCLLRFEAYQVSLRHDQSRTASPNFAKQQSSSGKSGWLRKAPAKFGLNFNVMWCQIKRAHNSKILQIFSTPLRRPTDQRQSTNLDTTTTVTMPVCSPFNQHFGYEDCSHLGIGNWERARRDRSWTRTWRWRCLKKAAYWWYIWIAEPQDLPYEAKARESPEAKQTYPSMDPTENW